MRVVGGAVAVATAAAAAAVVVAAVLRFARALGFVRVSSCGSSCNCSLRSVKPVWVCVERYARLYVGIPYVCRWRRNPT